MRQRTALSLYAMLAAALGACGNDANVMQGQGGAGAANSESGGGLGSDTGGGRGGAGVDGGNPAGGSGSGWSATECFDWPPPDGTAAVGGSGGIGGTGAQGGAASAQGGASSAQGGAASAQGGSASAPLVCPSRQDAYPYLQQNGCGTSITSEGSFVDGQCCYETFTEGCVVGRPFIDAAGQAMRADPASASDWGAAGAEPDRTDLTPEQRSWLADRWERDAFLEHASVASFGRFALELMAVGAPSGLVERAHEAALDEIRHARLGFQMVRAFSPGRPEPGPMPFGGSVDVASDGADIARRTVAEGCIGETMAAALAAEQADAATDPAARAVLRTIAADEARHAELAWRAVAWLIRQGGERVRSAVREAFDAALTQNLVADCERPGVPSHGLLPSSQEIAIMRLTRSQVIEPLARQLLGDATN